MIIVFQNTLFLKNFLRAMAVLGYLAKLKKGLGVAFGAHFLHDFSIKSSLFSSSSMDKVSMSHLIFFQDIKQNMLLSYYLDSS